MKLSLNLLLILVLCSDSNVNFTYGCPGFFEYLEVALYLISQASPSVVGPSQSCTSNVVCVSSLFQVRRGVGTVASTRRLGPVQSKRIYTLLTSRDPSLTLVQQLHRQFPFLIQFSIKTQHYHVLIFPSLSSMIGFYPIKRSKVNKIFLQSRNKAEFQQYTVSTFEL